jgi:hypothetical protein
MSAMFRQQWCKLKTHKFTSWNRGFWVDVIIRWRRPACKPFCKTSATLSGSCAMLLRLR